MERYRMIAAALNLIVDFLLLLGAGRLSGYPCSLLRCALAACLGGCYSVFCLTFPQTAFSRFPGRLMCLALMGLIAYGTGMGGIRSTGLFGLLTTALEGLAIRLGRTSAGALPCAAVIMWCLCRMAFREGTARREYRSVELCRDGRRRKLLALHDTGNTLRDPVTGESVLVVASEVGEYLTGMTAGELAAPLDTMLRRPIPGLRLVPYRTVGQREGLMLALTMEDVQIDNWRGKKLVAFAPQGLGEEEGYQGLIGG